jgi:hypothetical protein
MSNNNTASTTVVNNRGEKVSPMVDFWFSFRREGRVTEVCVRHHDWALARRRVKEAYSLRDEEIETL